MSTCPRLGDRETHWASSEPEGQSGTPSHTCSCTEEQLDGEDSVPVDTPLWYCGGHTVVETLVDTIVYTLWGQH